MSEAWPTVCLVFSKGRTNVFIKTLPQPSKDFLVAVTKGFGAIHCALPFHAGGEAITRLIFNLTQHSPSRNLSAMIQYLLPNILQ